jgi:hypothetical protein
MNNNTWQPMVGNKKMTIEEYLKIYELEKEILGALARGYCYDVNTHKVLDADLIFSIACEVEKVFKSYRANTKFEPTHWMPMPEGPEL